MRRDPSKKILEAFTRHEVPVAQCFLAKLRKLPVTTAIDGNANATLGLNDIKRLFSRLFSTDYIEHL
jgi:hypothetical protein